MSQEAKNEIIFWCGTIAAIVFASCLMVLLTGCGHNILTFGDGFQIEGGFIPQEYKITFAARWGKILTVCARENTEIVVEGDGKVKAESATDAGEKSKVTIKIGPQITGYFVDALKAGAKPAELRGEKETKEK